VPLAGLEKEMEMNIIVYITLVLIFMLFAVLSISGQQSKQ